MHFKKKKKSFKSLKIHCLTSKYSICDKNYELVILTSVLILTNDNKNVWIDRWVKFSSFSQKFDSRKEEYEEEGDRF